jgi:hypothetical protein
MVLAVTNPLRHVNGSRLKNPVPSRRVMSPAAVEAAERGLLKGSDLEAQKRAQLMIAAKAAVYVTDKIPPGKFMIVDPATADPADGPCPFKQRTLVVHPEDIDQALAQFQADG